MISFAFALLSCQTNHVIEEPLKVITINITNDKINVNYPQVQDANIDNFVVLKITKLMDSIEKNFQLEQVNITYQYYMDSRFITFVFDINIQSKNGDNRLYYRSYNFDYENNFLLFIPDNDLQSLYLDKINKNIPDKIIQYSFYDVLALNYIIQNDKVLFIIPELSGKGNYYLLEFDNVNYVANDISNKNNNQKTKKVALTFDDGPSVTTPNLIALLQKYQIKATFFVLGNQVEIYPNYLQLLHNNNFEIGNHSYSHNDFSKMTKEEIEFEVKKTQELIYKYIGIYPKIFRFPYGAFRNEALAYIKMPVILWNIDSNDWRIPGRSIILDNIFSNLVDESIILFHDNTFLDIELIDEVIYRLLQEKYEFVSIYEFFNFKDEENIIDGRIYR